MSDEEHSDEERSDEATEEEPGPIDRLGIPMSREPTIDDVRSDGEQHRRLAFGCTALVTLFVVAFWLVRGYLL
jgi:hypothetical protein